MFLLFFFFATMHIIVQKGFFASAHQIHPSSVNTSSILQISLGSTLYINFCFVSFDVFRQV